MEPKFTNTALDFELARRRVFPPASLRMFPEQTRAEFVSVGELRAELDNTPIDHPERAWREFEYALAVRQAQKSPRKKFYRVVWIDINTAASAA